MCRTCSITGIRIEKVKKQTAQECLRSLFFLYK